ncbi:Ig-like domain-containing protein [Klebsiella pneumoniae subsp. pneumoniae]|nr:Ig-like domain-containing protein [Klebsiella pneumoniae subsp. pneumoniae]
MRSNTPGRRTSGGLTNDATPALSGTAEAGATVTGLTTARCWAPRWRMRTGTGASLSGSAGRGSTRLSTTVTDVAGNTSGHSPDFVLTVDTTVVQVQRQRPAGDG